jgi:hypothetical protein
MLSGEPERYSSLALLRERMAIEQAYLLMRQEDAERIAESRMILHGISDRVGPRAVAPTLDGDARQSLMSDLAVAYSNCGMEEKAIDITRWLFSTLGVPERTSEIVDWLDGSPSGQRSRPRVVVHLNNLTVRRMKLGYLALLAGDRDAAADCLARGYEEGLVALELRSQEKTFGAAASRLLSKANLIHIRLEQAMLIDDLAARQALLAELAEEARAVVSESYDVPSIRPNARLIRAAIFGMIVLERAVAFDATGNDLDAEAFAWTARVAMKPAVDLHEFDADEAVGRAVRYADACRLSGASATALHTWRRTRRRLALYHGSEAPCLAALDARIDSVGVA